MKTKLRFDEMFKVIILILAVIASVFLILLAVSALRDKSAKKAKPVEGPALAVTEVEPYDPADADLGMPEFADKIEGKFDVTVGDCFLRAYPERDEANVYGKLKEKCILHVSSFYITVAEDGMTFYGVNADRLTANMIEAAEGCDATFDTDKDGIVWFAKTYATLSK